MGNGNSNSKLAEADVERFFAALDGVRESQLMVLTAMGRNLDRAEHEEAWKEVRRAADANGILREVQAIGDRAMHWASRGTNIPPLQPVPGDHELWVATRMQAAPAIVDAAVAIALGNLLDEASREILLGPWLVATGRPE
jgi:hypothetical protein